MTTVKEHIEKRLTTNSELHNKLHTECQEYLELTIGKADIDFDDLLTIEGTHLGLHVEKMVLKGVLRQMEKEE